MRMKTFVVLPLLAVTSAVYAQKSGDWHPATTPPVVFGKNVDAALFRLKDAWGRGLYRSEGKIGRGTAVLEMRVRNRSVFNIELVRYNPKATDPFQSQTLIGNKGKFYLLSKEKGFQKLAAGSDPGFGSSQGMVKAWPLHLQQLVWQSYVTGKGVFGPLMQGLVRGDGGYTIRMDQRTLQAEGRSYPQMRIFASRRPALVKKLGESSIEIVVDAQMWLPLQIRVIERLPNQPKSLYEWTTSWKGPQKFEDKYFATPTYQKITLPTAKS